MGSPLKSCLTAVFLFLQIYLYAQEKAENIIKANIPDSLTKDADAVCRLDETEVEIKSPGRIVVRERHMYTILNERAEELAKYVYRTTTNYPQLITLTVPYTIHRQKKSGILRKKICQTTQTMAMPL